MMRVARWPRRLAVRGALAPTYIPEKATAEKAELIPCYGGRVFPARAEFIAGSLGRERGFSAIYRSCGFWMHRGERRSARPSQFGNQMISLFENIEVCHVTFSPAERLRMLIRGEW